MLYYLSRNVFQVVKNKAEEEISSGLPILPSGTLVSLSFVVLRLSPHLQAKGWLQRYCVYSNFEEQQQLMI